LTELFQKDKRLLPILAEKLILIGKRLEEFKLKAGSLAER
jgi:hypothetical protein